MLFITNTVMAGRAFMVAKEVFHFTDGNIWKLEKWLNDASRSFYLCNDPKAKVLEKSRMVTRKRGIDLREET